VRDVRVKGAIGVIEVQGVDPRTLRQKLIDKGVWIRPFGNIIYTTPPLTISDADLATLTGVMVSVVGEGR
jgi:adenosylmethionine-8-amino-7-oxononanoate aminotransferase